MKNKIVFKSQKDFVKWVTVSNMFAKSRIMPMVALKQYNSLKDKQRTNIKKAIEEVTETLGDDGRILVRESGTEPLIRVMVEAQTDEICHENVLKVVNLIKEKGYAVK